MRLLAAICTAALAVGTVSFPEILGEFDADDFRPGVLSLPAGAAIVSERDADASSRVLRVVNTCEGVTWIPLFALADLGLPRGDLSYGVEFQTDLPANYVQPGIRYGHVSGDSSNTSNMQNFSTLTHASPPSFAAHGTFTLDRSTYLGEPAVGILLYGPGTVEIDYADVRFAAEPFRGFSTATLGWTAAAVMLIGIAGYAGYRTVSGFMTASVSQSVRKVLRFLFAFLFAAGFFILPQFQSDWMIPSLVIGALGFLGMEIQPRRRTTGAR